MHTAIVKKWGNSLALRLPRHLAADLRIAEGATVTLSVENRTLIVTPARRRFTLDELLAGAKPEHRHREVEWGKPLGEESW